MWPEIFTSLRKNLHLISFISGPACLICPRTNSRLVYLRFYGSKMNQDIVDIYDARGQNQKLQERNHQSRKFSRSISQLQSVETESDKNMVELQSLSFLHLLILIHFSIPPHILIYSEFPMHHIKRQKRFSLGYGIQLVMVDIQSPFVIFLPKHDQH